MREEWHLVTGRLHHGRYERRLVTVSSTGNNDANNGCAYRQVVFLDILQNRHVLIGT